MKTHKITLGDSFHLWQEQTNLGSLEFETLRLFKHLIIWLSFMFIFLIENSPPLKGKVLLECKLSFLMKTFAVDGVALILAELAEVVAVGVDVELEDIVWMVGIEESDVQLVVEVDVDVK